MKNVEYWIEEVDEHGDIQNFLYQENNKREALRIARSASPATGIHIEMERVVRTCDSDGSHAENKYEQIDWR